MDLSALIFVALAVAWAAYLIPKALKHHEDAQQSRPVEGFSESIRVLARREPVDSRSASLVATKATKTTTTTTATTTATTVEVRPEVARAAAARAAKRRRRVLSLILLANAGVAVAAYLGRLGWGSLAVTAALLVAWLVACRLMVKKERAVAPVRSASPAAVEPEAVEEGPQTEEMAAVAAEVRDPGSWDPVPVTLPTYVDKEAAARSVRTIDLDSTGVWSSGRNESDSRLAREADDAARAAKSDAAEERRAANDG